MKITKQFLIENNACDQGIEYFEKKDFKDIDAVELAKKLMKDKKYHYASWLTTEILDNTNCIRYAIFAAEQVIDIFERYNDIAVSPRVAIAAAKRFVETRVREKDTLYAAEHAAYEAAYAAGAAARATAYKAYAINAVRAEADAAGYEAANAMREKIAGFGIELLKQQS